MNDEPNRSREPEVTPTSPSSQRVDWQVVLDITAGDRDLLVQVLQAVQIELPQMLQEARRALEAEDASTLRRAAHTIKNACYNLGDQATGELAFELEQIGRDGRFGEVPARLVRLQQQVQQILAEVDLYLQRGEPGDE